MTPTHRSHDPAGIAATRGGYAQAVDVAPGCRYLFVSGQVPVRPDGSVPESFAAQCHVVWDNLLHVLDAAGYEPRHLVKITTFLASTAYGEENGAIRRERLGPLRPALTVIIAGLYERAWLLEIEAIAARPD